MFFILIFSESYSVIKDWKEIDRALPPSSTSYSSLKCADSLNCFVWGAILGTWGYYFRRTTDGGQIWKDVYLDSSYYNSGSDYKFLPRIREISYSNQNLFIAIGDSGTIIRSTNKGMTWKKITFMKNKFFFKIRMYDDKYGIAMCGLYNPVTIEPHYTEDGGQTWYKMNYPPFIESTLFEDYQFLNKNLFVALVKTDSIHAYLLWVKGNWDEWHLESAFNDSYYMNFLNEKEGWLSGGKLLDQNGNFSQTIYHTTDAGKNWDVQRDTNFNAATIHELIFVNKNYGMAVSNWGCYFTTTNGGRKWNEFRMVDRPNDQYYSLRELQVVSDKNAYVIAGRGTIYKYTRDLTEPQNHEPKIPIKPQGNSPDSVYLSYTYSTKTSDPDGDSVKYYFDWGDGKLSEWTNLSGSSEQISVSHTWDSTGFFQVRVKARDKDEMESEWSNALLVKVIGDVKPQNRPPDKPTKPEGSMVDSIYKSYEYFSKANDIDGDSLSYFFDWGDSTASEWTEYFSSGTQVVSSHTWNKTGEFTVSVRAKDTKESLSNWSDSLKIEVVGKIIGVEEVFKSMLPDIYPNPTEDFSEISVGLRHALTNTDIRIFNVFGETVIQSPEFLNNSHFTIFNSQLRINVSGLPSGVYFVRVGDKVSKFVKI